MKKAKIMLSAIAVIAVVSGAVAFKASRFTANTFFSYGSATTKIGGPIVTGCVVPVATFRTTDPSGVQTNLLPTTFITNTSTPCTTLVIASDAE